MLSESLKQGKRRRWPTCATVREKQKAGLAEGQIGLWHRLEASIAVRW